MADRAHVTSVDEIDRFRASLIVYIEKATVATDDVIDSVNRTRLWLQNDQRTHWEAQIRKRTKLLEMAQQELFSARSAGLREATTVKQMAVVKAKRSLEEASLKLDVLKKWCRFFDHEADPQVKQMEKLRTIVASDLRKAVFYLNEILKSLEDYTGRAPAPEEAPPAAPLPPAEHAADELTAGGEEFKTGEAK